MRWMIALGALATAAGCGDNGTEADEDTAMPVAKICVSGDPLSVLVITRQTLFDHASNPVAAQAIRAMGAARGWRVEVAGDPIVIPEGQLTRTDVVVFSITSGNILEPDQRTLLERFFRSGGGYAGTHSASATEWDWPFYTELVAANFQTHPPLFEGHAKVEAPADPIVAGLPDPWVRPDEYFSFDRRPEDQGVHVLLSLDEATVPADYPPELKVGYHPIAWTHTNAGGRRFYNSLGHTVESYSDPMFLQMLERGIAWAGADHYAARCGAGPTP
jgi:type 1 glutamine amidotransferase